MKTEKTEATSMELMPSAPAASSNLLAVIERAAADPSIDVDKMERLLALHERIVAKKAEEEFNVALSSAQKEMPRIVKDAHNESTRSAYVRLETLNDVVIPIYTRHGFSLSFGTSDSTTPEHIRITCIVSHASGHSRDYKVDLPNDYLGAKGNPSKTKVHGAGSTLSYGRRYLTLLIFNITIVGEDDDGNRGNRPKPQGPSTMAADDLNAEALVRELWNLLGEHRGTEKNWNAANQYLFELGIMSDTERMPRLPARRIQEIISELKQNLG